LVLVEHIVLTKCRYSVTYDERHRSIYKKVDKEVLESVHAFTWLFRVYEV